MGGRFISDGPQRGQPRIGAGGNFACRSRVGAAVPSARIKSRPTPARLIAALLLAQLLTVGSAAACDPAAFDFDAYLREQDRNRDNRLSRAELLAGPDGIGQSYGGTLDRAVNTDAAFDYLDSNRDGLLDRNELWKWGVFTHIVCADWPENGPDEG